MSNILEPPLSPSWPDAKAPQAGIPELSSFLPHRHPMQLVDQVVCEDNGSGEVLAWVQADRPYFRSGTFQSFWLIEIMAQGVAAIYALATMRQGQQAPSRGFLIAIDRYETVHPHPKLCAGERLSISVRLLNIILPVGRYECRIEGPSGLLASATMKFYIDDGAYGAQKREQKAL